MKLELSTSVKWTTRASEDKEEISFTVVDLDKAETYPGNFVCLLPKRLEAGRNDSKFHEIYGKSSQQIATKLLTKALRRERSPQVKNEIEKRLKAIKQKPSLKANCIDCGCIFMTKKVGRYVQRRCQTCRSKNKHSS